MNCMIIDMYSLYVIHDRNKMSTNSSNSSEDKRVANYAVKIVAVSISVGIALSFIFGYVINGGWT